MHDIEVAISIHALHEESDLLLLFFDGFECISIHALHEESDFGVGDLGFDGVISIHALHEESDSSRIAACPNPR